MENKKRTLQLLPMDELQYRPCEVNGRPALFHRWIEEDRVLLKINGWLTPEEQSRHLYNLHKRGLVAPDCSTEVLRVELALVEYTDGTVAKVEPECVRFIVDQK